MLCLHLYILHAHEVVLKTKTIFYVVYVKNDKNLKSAFLRHVFYLFCKAHKICQFFTKVCVST
jgi:hypothetical protein